MSVNCDQLSSRHQATGPRAWTAAGQSSPTKGCRVTGSWLFKKIYNNKKNKKKKQVINLWVSLWQTGSGSPACEQWLLHLAKRNKKNIVQHFSTCSTSSQGFCRRRLECDRQKVRPITFQVLSRFPDCTYEVNHKHTRPRYAFHQRKQNKKKLFQAACNFEQRWGNISNMHECKTLQRVSACSHTVTGDLLIGTDTAGVPKCGNFISL